MPRLSAFGVRQSVERLVATGLYHGSRQTMGVSGVFADGTFEALDALRKQAEWTGLTAVFDDAVALMEKEYSVCIPMNRA